MTKTGTMTSNNYDNNYNDKNKTTAETTKSATTTPPVLITITTTTRTLNTVPGETGLVDLYILLSMGMNAPDGWTHSRRI